MKEIKIGTIVRVKDDLEINKRYGDIYFSDEMEDFRGHIGKVINIFKPSRVTSENIYQIENFKFNSIGLLTFLAGLVGIEEGYKPEYYCFSKEMLDVVEEPIVTDYTSKAVEESKVEITVDKDELHKQIKDEFINNLPTKKSIRTQITITDIDNDTYSSQIITTLAEGQEKANFALFIATLKALREMAERLLNIGDYPYQIEELFNKYIDLIDEDLEEFDSTGDI